MLSDAEEGWNRPVGVRNEKPRVVRGFGGSLLDVDLLMGPGRGLAEEAADYFLAGRMSEMTSLLETPRAPMRAAAAVASASSGALASSTSRLT